MFIKKQQQKRVRQNGVHFYQCRVKLLTTTNLQVPSRQNFLLFKESVAFWIGFPQGFFFLMNRTTISEVYVKKYSFKTKIPAFLSDSTGLKFILTK